MNTIADIEKLVIVVKVKGKDHPMQVYTDRDNTKAYLLLINQLEGGITIIDKPIRTIDF